MGNDGSPRRGKEVVFKPIVAKYPMSISKILINSVEVFITSFLQICQQLMLFSTTYIKNRLLQHAIAKMQQVELETSGIFRTGNEQLFLILIVSIALQYGNKVPSMVLYNTLQIML